MERVVLRIDNLKSYQEYGHPVLIFIDGPSNKGQVLYCAATGHGEGDYNALIKQTRPMTQSELDGYHGEIYGYKLSDFKIVKKRVYGR